VAREERGEFRPGPVGFLPVYCLSNYISKGRRLANMGAFKPFMGRTMFMGSDRRRFFIEII
jgi:hypothetical protein